MLKWAGTERVRCFPVKCFQIGGFVLQDAFIIFFIFLFIFVRFSRKRCGNLIFS